MSMERKHKEIESPKNYALAQWGLRKCPYLTTGTTQSAGVFCPPPLFHQAMLGAYLPLCPHFLVYCITSPGRFSPSLCQFYSCIAMTMTLKGTTSSYSQDSGHVHNVTQVRGEGAHSVPCGYEGDTESQEAGVRRGSQGCLSPWVTWLPH